MAFLNSCLTLNKIWNTFRRYSNLEYPGLNISRIFKILKSYCYYPGGEGEGKGTCLCHDLDLRGEKVKGIRNLFIVSWSTDMTAKLSTNTRLVSRPAILSHHKPVFVTKYNVITLVQFPQVLNNRMGNMYCK